MPTTPSPWQPALDRLLAIRLPVDPGEADLPDDVAYEVWDAVRDLIEARGSSDIAELVADAAATGALTNQEAALYLNIAAWCGTDDAAALQRTLNGWVRTADDRTRLAVALLHQMHMSPAPGEVVPRQHLTEIAHRYPELRELCAYHLAARPAD
ncbi:hypothetical protein F7Q99_31605 [Streptomyces kaniharaensis]|uniref:Uncharacterized protein n=1 Tax=Streptomyces kaniharaensis TaxID=212423 RepID=A0A6N7KYV3_9ACTN|nr:hypothetical protein [Streptomyces kaniharaensis]MQS16611.1 hypothetical protein [Streptomyces kaniharaensis]